MACYLTTADAKVMLSLLWTDHRKQINHAMPIFYKLTNINPSGIDSFHFALDGAVVNNFRCFSILSRLNSSSYNWIAYLLHGWGRSTVPKIKKISTMYIFYMLAYRIEMWIKILILIIGHHIWISIPNFTFQYWWYQVKQISSHSNREKWSQRAGTHTHFMIIFYLLPSWLIGYPNCMLH